MNDVSCSMSGLDEDKRASGEGSSSSPGDTSKRKRCHTGCAICRIRKVKCDERPNGCSNCERLQLKCPGGGQEQLPPVEELKLPPQAGIKRKKTYRSCNECRSSKTRCSGDRPRCHRCIRKRIECVYDADPDPGWTRNIRKASSSYKALKSQEKEHTSPTPSHSSLIPASNANEATNVASDDSQILSEHLQSLEWLRVTELPDKRKVRFLVEQYFDNIHPLRCFGFLHKPSFFQKLGDNAPSNPSGSALLLAVCALGAKFALLPLVSQMSPQKILAAGDQWAREASKLILADLDTISVENLMATVLLHDHELRVGRFASAFMLSGIGARMAQALQVNLEYSADIFCTDSPHRPSPVSREARRRLMWSCYVMDAWVGSGVDQLTLFDNSDIKIQLPVSEKLFLEQTPAITETLEPGQTLRCLPRDVVHNNPAQNMGIEGFFVRLTNYRKQVLKFVKHLDQAQSPWLPDSEFSYLDGYLSHWYRNLPPKLLFNEESQEEHHKASQLGALVLLHCTFHQTNVDLYRIGTPRLFKIRENIHFPPERLGFLTSIRQTCFHHASQISRILQTATVNYGIKALADTWLAIVVHDTNRVMLYYLTNFIDMTSMSSGSIVTETLSLILSNLEILKMMIPLFSMSSSLYEASSNLIHSSGITGQLQNPSPSTAPEPESSERPTAPNTPVQSTPEYVLNPLAIYRLARRSVSEREKHQPELHPSSKPRDEATPSQAQAQGWYTSEPSQFPPSASATSNTVPLNQFTPAYNTATAPQIADAAYPHLSQTPVSFMIRSKFNIPDDMFFASNLDTIWQPAETVLESTGIAPWGSEAGGWSRVGYPSVGGGADSEVFLAADTVGDFIGS